MPARRLRRSVTKMNDPGYDGTRPWIDLMLWGENGDL